MTPLTPMPIAHPTAAPEPTARRLRIAVIVGGFPKLSETFILNQITGLLDLGHHVDIYARRQLHESFEHDEVREYALLSRTRAFDLPSSRRGRLLRALGSAARYLPSHPRAILRCMSLSQYGSVYAVLNNLMHVPPFLQRRYDVILCHFGGNGIDFAFIKRLFPATRMVTMFHGDDMFLGDEHGQRIFDTLRSAGDLFLVNTDYFGGAKLRAAGFDPIKVVTLHYGLRIDRIPFRERALRNSTVRILSVGRLVPKKGHEFAIRGVDRLAKANPELRIEYRIIGDGELRQSLNDLIRALGRADTIQLLGGLPGHEVMRWMDGSDLFLLPSLMEQAGMVLAEAQASGLPVVATRVGGVPEMVEPGQSALLVRAGDAVAITCALQHLLDDPTSWAIHGRAGRTFVEHQHDLCTQTARLAALLAP